MLCVMHDANIKVIARCSVMAPTMATFSWAPLKMKRFFLCSLTFTRTIENTVVCLPGS